MGTSVNQRSPNNDNWRLAQEAYGNQAVPIPEALRSVWRAASNRNEVNLASLLARPEIAELAELSGKYSSPAEAAREVTRFVSERKVASLASDIAKRAAMQSAGKQDARAVFVQRLFAEATSYLIDRDLPGYVSAGSRFPRVSDARRFSQEVVNTAAEAARSTPLPTQLTRDSWPGFVDQVIRNLRRRP